MKNLKPLALSLVLGSFCAAQAQADEAALQAQVDKLTAELEALKNDIQQLHSQTEAIATQQESEATTESSAQSSAAAGATLWGYGEINYNHPTASAPANMPEQDNAARMDLRRAVFGIGYKFNDKTRFVSEFEVEHAVASADDGGEVEVEQFYIDHQLGQSTHLKAGLFLIPAGLLNENHEPTHYYGVERNFVETAIIPSTWREGGVGLYGVSDSGLAWDVGITTTVDLSAWDASSTEAQESPLGSIHQELQMASANDLGVYGALNFRGIPGLVVGTSAFTSKVAQDSQVVALASDSRLLLWDTHARWTPGNWDLSAVYARGTLSDTQALNLTFAGMPSPVPKAFFGWYTQAAYKVWQNGSYSLAPFVRYEQFNTAAEFEAMPQGLEFPSAETEKVTTLGASFYLNPNVVVKLDYQDFAENSSLNRVDLGLGLAF